MNKVNCRKCFRLGHGRVWLLLAAVAVTPGLACSGGSDGSIVTSGSGGNTNAGGAPGGTGAQARGGTSTGAGGAAAAGGTTGTGGFSVTGGATTNSGGTATGGTTAGGTATGGTATGGTAMGGTATGGKAAGGSSIGGATAGGAATGGVTSVGGSAVAGNTTGGKATGGNAAGGNATGGVATGGKAAGGSATGGTAIGGAATGGNGIGGSGTGGASDCNTPPAASPLVGWAAVSGGSVTTTTGGGNATPQTVTTLAALNSAAAGTGAAVIYVKGVLAAGTVNIGSNKTIVGLCGAELHGTVNVNGSTNVIVRNIKIVGYNCTDSSADCSAGADAVHVSNGAHHVWFDHDDVSDGSDGNFDINAASDFVTVSWTKFSYSSARTDPVAGASGHRFSNLVGSADNVASDVGKLNVTYHHNWWANNVDQRMPRVRYGKIHVYNNLYTMTGNNYCVGVGMGANVLVENNAFIGVTRPVNSASFADSTTILTSVGNLMTNTSGGTATDIGVAFTPTYQYTADAASTIQSAVQSGAGPH